MTTLPITVPDQVSALLGLIAARAGCTPEAYAAVCVVGGLAEQFRYRGPEGARLAHQLMNLAQSMLDQHGISRTTVHVPPEVRSILDYEVAAQLHSQ